MKYSKVILLLILGILMLTPDALASTTLRNLQVEYQTNPLGIDVTRPRFNWQMESERYGARQSAYQLFVSDTPDGLANGEYIYDSGKISSSQSVGVEYQGTVLQPSTRYYWKVDVWDENGAKLSSTDDAWFETGLVGSGWSGARWIGSRRAQLSRYRSSFIIDYDVEIAKGSDRSNFIFGARDEKNYVSVGLDMAGGEGARFILSHSTDGVCHTDAEEDISSIVPKGAENGKHHVRLRVTTAQYALKYFVDVEIDGKPLRNTSLSKEERERKNRGDAWGVKEGEFSVYPYPDGKLVFHCRLYSIGFMQPKGQRAKYSSIKISEPSWGNILYSSDLCFDEVGDGKMNIWSPGDEYSAPMLRRSVDIKKPIKSARLYATARGIYQFSINGKRVGNDYFNPGWTDYRYRIMYNTYDITEMLTVGENGIGAMLGTGWWSDHNGFLTSWQDQYGSRESLLAKILIVYQDGSSETIVTDNSWRCFDEGPITSNSLQNGEEYDARREVDGWDMAQFDDSSWEEVDILPAPAVNVEIEAYVGSPVRNNITLGAKSVVEP